MKTAICLFSAIFLLSGCATVNISKVGGKTMVDITNTGWFVFNIVPVACGNPDAPNENSCRFFTNTTTLKNNLALLDYAATREGACATDNIVSYTTDESIFMILLKRHACHTSAELVMDPYDAARRSAKTEE